MVRCSTTSTSIKRFRIELQDASKPRFERKIRVLSHHRKFSFEQCIRALVAAFY